MAHCLQSFDHRKVQHVYNGFLIMIQWLACIMTCFCFTVCMPHRPLKKCISECWFMLINNWFITSKHLQIRQPLIRLPLCLAQGLKLWAMFVRQTGKTSAPITLPDTVVGAHSSVTWHEYGPFTGAVWEWHMFPWKQYIKHCLTARGKSTYLKRRISPGG